ncbi:hypothetical protein ABIC89_005540 [Variovorax boronicumulans]|uniref:hypothetical protein n=1 Tax=Variovorax boronicumulans TaxID=436515 RepID=UPI003398CE4B
MVVDVSAKRLIERRRIASGQSYFDRPHNGVTKDLRHAAPTEVSLKQRLGSELGRCHGIPPLKKLMSSHYREGDSPAVRWRTDRKQKARHDLLDGHPALVEEA